MPASPTKPTKRIAAGPGTNMQYMAGRADLWSYNYTGVNRLGHIYPPSGYNWADQYSRFVSIDIYLVIAKLMDSQYGGRWSLSSGYKFFKTDTVAALAGARYNNFHDSWKNTSVGDIDTYLNNFAPEGTISIDGIFVDKTISDEYRKAIFYLMQSAKGAKIISFLQENVVGLQVWSVRIKAAFLRRLNLIVWNWYEGLKYKKKYHSPSLLLMHEFAHAYQYHRKGERKFIRIEKRKVNTRRWGSKADGAEIFAVKVSDKVASQLGQDTRGSYRGGSEYFPSVNSNVPDITRMGRYIYNTLRFRRELNIYQQHIRKKVIEEFKYDK